MSSLFSHDVSERERAAAEYKVFSKSTSIPDKHRDEWGELLGPKGLEDGIPWPHKLAELAQPHTWPEFAFGTANAACILIWHRPGKPGEHGLYIEPRVPVLGGIGHAHNVFWPRYHSSPSWRLLHKYLPLVFKGLKSPWSQVMTACINAEPGATRKVDLKANKDTVNSGILDHIVSLCQPRVILLCGTPVHKATTSWNASSNVEILRVPHPSTWDGYGGHGSQGPAIVRRLKELLL